MPPITAIFAILSFIFGSYFIYRVYRERKIEIQEVATLFVTCLAILVSLLTNAESNKNAEETLTPQATGNSANFQSLLQSKIPDENALIERISVSPDLSEYLFSSRDTSYTFKVRYLIPEYDWKSAGYQPHIRILSRRSGSNEVYMLLNDIIPVYGSFQVTDITGRFFVPVGLRSLQIRVEIFFENVSTGTGIVHSDNVLTFEYAIQQ